MFFPLQKFQKQSNSSGCYLLRRFVPHPPDLLNLTAQTGPRISVLGSPGDSVVQSGLETTVVEGKLKLLLTHLVLCLQQDISWKLDPSSDMNDLGLNWQRAWTNQSLNYLVQTMNKHRHGFPFNVGFKTMLVLFWVWKNTHHTLNSWLLHSLCTDLLNYINPNHTQLPKQDYTMWQTASKWKTKKTTLCPHGKAALMLSWA